MQTMLSPSKKKVILSPLNVKKIKKIMNIK